MKSRYIIIMLAMFTTALNAQKIEVSSDQKNEKLVDASSTGDGATAIYGEVSGVSGTAVIGIAHAGESKGVYGSGKVGVYGYGITGILGGTSIANGNAGRFSGNVKITGDLEIHGFNNEMIYPDGTRQGTAFVPHDLFYTRSFESGVIGPNASATANCFCDQGDKALGGGWDAYRNESPHHHDIVSNTYYNKPTFKVINGDSTGGWEIGFRNNSGEFYRVRVFVQCANIN